MSLSKRCMIVLVSKTSQVSMAVAQFMVESRYPFALLYHADISRQGDSSWKI